MGDWAASRASLATRLHRDRRDLLQSTITFVEENQKDDLELNTYSDDANSV